MEGIGGVGLIEDQCLNQVAHSFPMESLLVAPSQQLRMVGRVQDILSERAGWVMLEKLPVGYQAICDRLPEWCGMLAALSHLGDPTLAPFEEPTRSGRAFSPNQRRFQCQ